jgi:hypothetical protein
MIHPSFGMVVMKIDETDARYLLGQIRACEAILVLGAGASFGGKNAANEPIKMGQDLARTLALSAGLPYADEPLSDVYEAIQFIIYCNESIPERLLRMRL